MTTLDQAFQPIFHNELTKRDIPSEAEDREFLSQTRLPYDACATVCSIDNSLKRGEYTLYEKIPSKQNEIEQKQISMLKELGTHSQNGVGWVGKDGELVQNDSNLRVNREQLTNPRLIHQVCGNPYISGPYLGAATGRRNYDRETVLMHGVQAGIKNQPSLRGFHCPRAAEMVPLHHKVRQSADPANWEDISWERMGRGTRMEFDGEGSDYKEACQKAAANKYRYNFTNVWNELN